MDVDENDIRKNIASAIDKEIEKRKKSILKSFESRKSAIVEFKESLEKFIDIKSDTDRQNILFVLVDELDRCRPLYAIDLLEKIKHVFDVSGIVFVIPTDTDQLICSICAVYGEKFDSRRYLKRFFDRILKFPIISRNNMITDILKKSNLIGHKISNPTSLSHEDFYVSMFNCYDLSMRDLKSCIDIIDVFISLRRNSFEIEIAILIPLVVIFHKVGRVERSIHKIEASLKSLRSETSFHWGRHAREEINIESLAIQMYASAFDIAPHIYSGHDGFGESYMRRRFTIEAQFRGLNVTNGGSKVKSIIVNYPDMIESVALFVSSDQSS